MLNRLIIIFKDIKIQHTVFAMPFAIIGAVSASNGMPDVKKLCWIILAMIFARSSAMAFNRVVDIKYDSQNPRTSKRPLPSNMIKQGSYISFIIISSTLFIFITSLLNFTAFILSPIALFTCLFYSYTKRFTHLSHLFLGIALGMAPIGAWIGITGRISIFPLILGASVVFWLAGLDIIYACQDIEFDRNIGLFSFPSKYGLRNALLLSSIFHIIMLLLLVCLIPIGRLGWLYVIGLVVVTGLLIYEHTIISYKDLSKINTAFFHTNGILSAILMVFTIADYATK